MPEAGSRAPEGDDRPAWLGPGVDMPGRYPASPPPLPGRPAGAGRPGSGSPRWLLLIAAAALAVLLGVALLGSGAGSAFGLGGRSQPSGSPSQRPSAGAAAPGMTAVTGAPVAAPPVPAVKGAGDSADTVAVAVAGSYNFSGSFRIRQDESTCGDQKSPRPGYMLNPRPWRTATASVAGHSFYAQIGLTIYPGPGEYGDRSKFEPSWASIDDSHFEPTATSQLKVAFRPDGSGWATFTDYALISGVYPNQKPDPKHRISLATAWAC